MVYVPEIIRKPNAAVLERGQWRSRASGGSRIQASLRGQGWVWLCIDDERRHEQESSHRQRMKEGRAQCDQTDISRMKM